MKIVDIERILLDVPFTERQQRITRRTVYNWSLLELCRVTTDTGHVGWGETVPHYTHQRVTDTTVERALGAPAAQLLYDDSIGAGLQMALFDVMGKALQVPVYRILGTAVRQATPISWWCSHSGPEDWAAESTEAVQSGYTSLKTKPRPWWDVFAQVEAVSKATPDHFRIDMDPNGTLDNAATAIPILRRLAEFDRVAMFETPIPQKDILGNRQIRRSVARPIAMHFGSPPFLTAVREEVCDGFVINGGASRVLREGILAAEVAMPFWLQLVGNGLTTTWAAHLGAVLSHAMWPTISCINLYSHHLLTQPIAVQGGYQSVPDKPGLGVEVDIAAVERYRVSADALASVQAGQLYAHPPPRLINTIHYPDGGSVHVAQLGAASVHHGPGWSSGVHVVTREDDDSKDFADLYQRVQYAPVRDRPSNGTE